MSLLLLFNQSSGGAGSGGTGTAFQSFVEAGMFLGNWDIDDYLTFTACIHDDTGAAADADAVPTYAIYEDETAAAIVTGTMAKLGAVDGFYTKRVHLTTANGFEIGKCYAIRIEATVGGVLAAAAHVFQMGGSGLTAQETADAVNNLAPTSTGAIGSIRAKLDAIRLITDAIDTSAVTVTASNDAGVLTVVQSVTFGATISGLTISGTWAKLYWTLKESIYDDDDQAILQLVESNPGAGTDGLLYLDSAAIVLPITIADGTLTVNQVGGTVAIVVTDNATALLSAASELVWDIKTKDAAGATVQNATGTASITRAVTQTI